jgi:hypothetical protein
MLLSVVEEDLPQLIKNSLTVLELTDCNYTISSTYENRNDKILLLNLDEKFEILKTDDKPIEDNLIKIIDILHDNFLDDNKKT